MRLGEAFIADIEVIDRFREDLGNIEELSISLKKEGIINPLAVYQQEGHEKPYRLLAGGRRIIAATRAGFDKVPVRIYDSVLTEEEMLTIELMENICRKDLEWYEEKLLMSAIHDLQVKIHGKKTQGTASTENPGWGRTDTARLLGVANSKVTQDIQLANMVKAAPVLKSCKTADEARKLVGKMFNKFQIAEIAKNISDKREKTPIDIQREAISNRFILMPFDPLRSLSVQGFFEGIKKIPDGSFDIVEIDPPYGIDLTREKKSEDNLNLQTVGYNEVPAHEYLPFVDRLLREVYRVMATNSWLLFWFGPEPWFDPIFQLIRKNNFEGRRIPAEWIKLNHSGQTKRPNIHLPGATEWFFYARKGDAAINKPGRKNTFEFPVIPAARKIHPTEKPIELMQEILDTFGRPGQRLLVPFAGSGNSILAADNIGIQGIGFDLTKEYKDSFTIKVYEGRPGAYASYR